MIIRRFRPGQRVQKKSGGPIMIVQKYQREWCLFLGTYESNLIVECSWTESGKYQRARLHQNNLIKITSDLKNSNSNRNNAHQQS